MSREKNRIRERPGDPRPLAASVKFRVCFSEVDALGIVWHGNYPKYFERAVTELRCRCGLSPLQLLDANTATPVVRLAIDYFKSVKLGETVTVEAKLFWNDGARLDFGCTVFSEAGETACTGTITELFVDLKTREPIWCDPEIWAECKRRWKNGEFYGKDSESR